MTHSKPNGASLRPTSQTGRKSPAKPRRLAAVEPALVCVSLLAAAARVEAQSAAPATNAPSPAALAGAAATTNGLPAFSFLPPKPAWLTDASFAAKESYDDNLYEVSGLGAKEKGSWITTMTPTFGVNLVPLLGQSTPFQALAFGYAPEFNFFHDQPSENYTAHRLAQTIKASVGDFSLNLENGFNYIDGNHTAPTYAGNDSLRSAYATGAPRERRAQIQDRSKITLLYDQPQWFLRPVASLISYDLLTDLSPAPGYQNYASRYDVNGGIDFGYKITPKLSATLGYRYGHQYQEEFPTAIDPTHLSATSDYQRVLVGLEGSPWKWLTFNAQAGPDFRSYDATAPVNDDSPITYYGEAGATATITSSDKLSLRYKQWRWVSSTGKLPLFESLYELNYHRKLTDQLGFDLTGRIQSSDYTCGDVSSSKRNDYLYSLATGLTYAFNRNLSCSVTYNLDLGRNDETGVTNPYYREFDHNLVSFGTTFKW